MTLIRRTDRHIAPLQVALVQGGAEGSCLAGPVSANSSGRAARDGALGGWGLTIWRNCAPRKPHTMPLPGRWRADRQDKT